MAAPYAVESGVASSAAIEDMLTIEPPPVCRIAAIPARQPRKTLSTLTEKICFQSANLVSSGVTAVGRAGDPGVVDQDADRPGPLAGLPQDHWPLVLAR